MQERDIKKPVNCAGCGGAGHWHLETSGSPRYQIPCCQSEGVKPMMHVLRCCAGCQLILHYACYACCRTARRRRLSSTTSIYLSTLAASLPSQVTHFSCLLGVGALGALPGDQCTCNFLNYNILSWPARAIAPLYVADGVLPDSQVHLPYHLLPRSTFSQSCGDTATCCAALRCSDCVDSGEHRMGDWLCGARGVHGTGHPHLCVGVPTLHPRGPHRKVREFRHDWRREHLLCRLG